MMLDDLTAILAAVPATATVADYSSAIIEGNCLSKQTVATRRHSFQHLRELYALDPQVPLFRVLGHLWAADPQGGSLLALLASLARDPLLLGTAASVIPLRDGAEFQRAAMRMAVSRTVGDRLNDSTIDKVARNAASSWAQSGHLQGRTFKIRQRVTATPGAMAFALYLANAAGFYGQEVLSSGWIRVLDCSTSAAIEIALEAKRRGLIDLRVAGDVFDLNLDRLDPGRVRR
jgi:hypothetical protein